MLFFLAFFSIYLAMHLFTWAKFSAQLSLSSRKRAWGCVVCVFLTITPFLAHLIPLTWPKGFTYIFWQLTFTWLAMIFYLFLFQIAVLAGRIVSWPFFRRTPLEGSSKIALAGAFLCILVTGWGFFEAGRPVKTAQYQLESLKLDQDIRIVFLSDLHLGVQKSSQRLARLINLMEQQEPDLIIFGGDVVNDHLEWLEDEAEQLKELNAPAGKYGVLGNHEFYPGVEKSLELFRQSEIIILDDEIKIMEDLGLVLMGVSDPAPFSRPREHQEQVTEMLLQDIDQDRFNLLISHRPWGFELAAQAGVDLHLAGHTHNGQIFPFRYLVRLQFRYVYGLYEKAGSRLIVTSGAGSWGPPIRVMAPAEIVVVDLVAGRDQPAHTSRRDTQEKFLSQ